MLYHCLAGLREVCDQLIVVGGSQIVELRSLLDRPEFGRVVIVENQDWQTGMFSSVQAGLRRMRAGAAFILPVDCPLVPSSVYRLLIQKSGLAVVPTYGKKRGHPVLVRGDLIREILDEPRRSSLRDVLARCGVTEAVVEAQEVLLDIDSPEELARLYRK
jgi:molybdenum cofactor cytidylyltransferase